MPVVLMGGGGAVDDKVGEGNERDARESSLQLGRRLRGGKVTGRKETVRKETGGKMTGAKETGGKATGGNATGVKASAAQDSQETGGKGDMLMDEREINNMLPGDTTAGQNATEGFRRNNYSEEGVEGVRRRARVIVGESIPRTTYRYTGGRHSGWLSRAKYMLSQRGWKNRGSGQGRFYFSRRSD